jgi:CDP-diacylglycerol--glycerol-3-phosphate 3-phosphatidyltransferase
VNAGGIASTAPNRRESAKDRMKHLAHAAVDPLVRLLARLGVGPDALTVLGLLLSGIAGLAFFEGLFQWGSGLALAAGLCDLLDGQVARRRGVVRPFGAFLDSTLDRIEEGIVLTAVAAVFAKDGKDFAAAAVVVAVLASLMVSYTRARAEALGVECKVGIANRAVRVVILSIGILFADLDALAPAVYVLAGLGTITVLQRIFHVRGELKRLEQPASEL